MLSTDLGHAVDEATRDAQPIADKLRAALSPPCAIAGVQHPCSASVGVQIFSGDDSDAGTLLKRADAAMDEDKKASRPDSVAR